MLSFANALLVVQFKLCVREPRLDRQYIHPGLVFEWQPQIPRGTLMGFLLASTSQPEATGSERVPHPYHGEEAGAYVAPGHLHECSHGSACRGKYGKLQTCRQLAGVNCNVHEQNHQKKKKFLPMINTMRFDRFSFMVTLINEIENEVINRRTLEELVDFVRAVTEANEHLSVCKVEIWCAGRCFCEKPLQLRYDQFGRARLHFL